jgi:hypothetical protein
MSEHQKIKNECVSEAETQKTNSKHQKLAGDWLIEANERHINLNNTKGVKRQIFHYIQVVKAIQKTNFNSSKTPNQNGFCPWWAANDRYFDIYILGIHAFKVM